MPQPRFFCLRGFMKSGTNWVGSLLSSHADISCVGEFHWESLVQAFNQIVKEEPIYLNPEQNLAEPAREHLEGMIRETMIVAAEDGAAVIGDRTPHRIAPVTLRGVPHICVIRDGRDVLVSRAFHVYNWPGVSRLFDRFPSMRETLKEFQADPWFFQKHPEALLCHETMVRESILSWRQHLEADSETARKLPDLPVLFIRYEDLHADVQQQRRRMFEFLDVDPDRAAKIEGVLQPGFREERPAEFLRKGAVGDWKNYFSDQTRSWFKEIAGDTLIDQGYADSMDW